MSNWHQCPRCGTRLRFTRLRVWCPRQRCDYDRPLPGVMVLDERRR